MEGKELVWLGLALQMFMLGLRKFGWQTTEYSSTSLKGEKKPWRPNYDTTHHYHSKRNGRKGQRKGHVGKERRGEGSKTLTE